VALLALSACVTTENSNYGSGPLPPFIPAVQKEIAVYLSRQELDRALAVSPDGRFVTRSYCERYGGIGRCGNNEIIAVADCNRRSGQQCKIIASDNIIVWRNPQPEPQTAWAISMEVGGVRYAGSAKTSTVPGLQLFTVDSPDGPCQGALVMTGASGSWAASCASGVTAGGQLSATGPRSSTGTGQDSTGRNIKFASARQ
jgi:hypothetical protein